MSTCGPQCDAHTKQLAHTHTCPLLYIERWTLPHHCVFVMSHGNAVQRQGSTCAALQEGKDRSA